ncbi:LCP family glycopolymer transferase CpsA [Streptococcus iniae]|uniref:LCP family glycopolymer transferase CpsA n=1 Tax=Streptococcus iniae TaxID=1346 RepID=UPI001604C87D|nr:LCP family protein [Streptococcus iniae]
MAHSRSKRKSSSKEKHNLSLINILLLIIYTGLSIIISFWMYLYNFLAFRQLNLVFSIGLVLVFFMCLFLIIKKKLKGLTSLILVISTILLAIMLFTFKSTIDFTAEINKTASFSEIEMSVIVPKESAINSISELETVQAPLKNDSENIDSLIKHIKAAKKKELKLEEVASYPEAYQKMLSNQSQAMVMNSAYMSLLGQEDLQFSDKVKTIYSYKIKKDIKAKKSHVTKAGVYNIYISGIDTYGPISTVSRSDVNIVMTVNMNTHKVLLTTTPRDSYVKIPNGGGDQFDKLTHAGIYGVETSMATLANLYGIEMTDYARINFTSFLNLIDMLGGIEVVNDKAFSAGGFDYPVGKISLNSQEALMFVRERKSLEGGDGDRGKNQEKVVSAIIRKLTMIKSPAQFSEIVTGLQTSIQTNLTLDQLMTIANAQLESNQSYDITSQDVTGTGSTGELPSYAMPGSALYMYQLDDASLNQAKEAIKAVMEESK